MTRNNCRTLLAEIEARGREHCEAYDLAHNASHLERVATNASLLIQHEKRCNASLDEFIVMSACWLHDIVQVPKGSGVPGEAATRSADVAATFLRQLQLDEQDILHICACISEHSFSSNRKPSSIEAALLQDADRIDALGAIGIARLWITAGALGSALYHPHDPAAKCRDLDDRSYGLDHFVAKLLRLPDYMNTASGRELALKRVETVQSYRDAFLAELQPQPGQS